MQTVQKASFTSPQGEMLGKQVALRSLLDQQVIKERTNADAVLIHNCPLVTLSECMYACAHTHASKCTGPDGALTFGPSDNQMDHLIFLWFRSSIKLPSPT